LDKVDAALAGQWDGETALMSTTNPPPVITVTHWRRNRLTLSDFVD
jgi:hypothetical protein